MGFSQLAISQKRNFRKVFAYQSHHSPIAPIFGKFPTHFWLFSNQLGTANPLPQKGSRSRCPSSVSSCSVSPLWPRRPFGQRRRRWCSAWNAWGGTFGPVTSHQVWRIMMGKWGGLDARKDVEKIRKTAFTSQKQSVDNIWQLKFNSLSSLFGVFQKVASCCNSWCSRHPVEGVFWGSLGRECGTWEPSGHDAQRHRALVRVPAEGCRRSGSSSQRGAAGILGIRKDAAFLWPRVDGAFVLSNVVIYLYTS